MVSVNNISFNGKFRYLGTIPSSIEEFSFFEVGEKGVSKQLVDFSHKSAFLNKLKNDRDVMLCHYREFTEPEAQQNKGFFSRLFSLKNYVKETETGRIGNDHVSVIFANNKPKNPIDTELCAIRISMPLNQGTPDNLDRFEKVLEKNSDIGLLKKIADRLFPKDSHKVAPLPNSNHGFCEFWTGKRTAGDTLDKLFLISKAQIQKIYEQINEEVAKKTFGVL